MLAVPLLHRSLLAIAVRSSLAVAPEAKSHSSKQRGKLTQPIEDIQIGDLVWAWDEQKSAHVRRPVMRLFRHQSKPIVAVTVVGDDGTQQRIESTTEHPFWVEGTGWVAACNLHTGDLLRRIDGSDCLWVASAELTGANADVFNFEVGGVHNYFVGLQGVLVHNESSREHIDLDPANSRPQIFGEGPKTSTSSMQPLSAREAPNSGETNTVWIGRTAHGRNDGRLAVKDTRLTEQARASSDRLIETVDEPAPNAQRPRQLIENGIGIRRANSSRTPYKYPSERRGHMDTSAEADFVSIGNDLRTNVSPGDWPRLLEPRVDVTSAYDLKTSKITGKIIATYGKIGGFGNVMVVSKDGSMAFSINAKADFPYPTPKPSGTDMFLSGLNALRSAGVTVRSIQGDWRPDSGSDNHADFAKAYYTTNLSPQAAAAQTWTGRMAAAVGWASVGDVTIGEDYGNIDAEFLPSSYGNGFKTP